MIAGFYAVLGSVPTVAQPEEHGPLSTDEIYQATEFMDRLAAQVRAARRTPDPPIIS